MYGSQWKHFNVSGHTKCISWFPVLTDLVHQTFAVTDFFMSLLAYDRWTEEEKNDQPPFLLKKNKSVFKYIQYYWSIQIISLDVLFFKVTNTQNNKKLSFVCRLLHTRHLSRSNCCTTENCVAKNKCSLPWFAVVCAGDTHKNHYYCSSDTSCRGTLRLWSHCIVFPCILHKTTCKICSQTALCV